jgi:uncharacterized protein (TIGR03067 family)
MPRVMIVCVVLAGMVPFGVHGDSPDPEPPGETSLKTLKGTWTVTKGVFKGHEEKVTDGRTYIFDGDKLTRTVPGGKNNGKLTYKVELDTRKKPCKITMSPDDGGKAREGVIKIENGELFLSVDGPKFRTMPSDFSGKDATVFVMKKQKGK